VREQAVESICVVGTAMSVAQLEEHVVPMVQRLAVDVGWAARVSACGLFGLVIHKKGISPGSASSMKELYVTFTNALRLFVLLSSFSSIYERYRSCDVI
jgi:hypothetical protein